MQPFIETQRSAEQLHIFFLFTLQNVNRFDWDLNI